jgi:hypothetical protein
MIFFLPLAAGPRPPARAAFYVYLGFYAQREVGLLALPFRAARINASAVPAACL